MRAETSATSAVVTLSVAVAAVGHVLISDGSIPLAVVPRLVALAAACWLLGDYLAGSRWLSVAVLAGIQLIVHVTLDAAHPAAAPAAMPTGHSHTHDMPGMAMPMPEATSPPPMHDGVAGALTMTAAHLLVLLAGVVLIGRAHQWASRVLRVLARLVPQLPAAVVLVVPTLARGLTGVPDVPQLRQRWLTSNVSRRGPPAVALLIASS
ncbi:hypothetical protein ACFPJ1_27430 [Kribbella qitaiheensis]|uniref:hypothetical protein n=1 Tax=Kribbella qitaiheensis TaxID=1544730 RepID=UPI003619BB07